MIFNDLTNEAQFIEEIRSIFRAHVPESDGWQKPNFFDVNSVVIGGLVWSAVSEARNGVDARINPQTASGDNLDILAALPPLNLVRLQPTPSSGSIRVNFPALTIIPAGYEFTSAAGIVFKATSTIALTAGEGIVPVESSTTGSAANSPTNQPMVTTEGTAISLGVFGGNDLECDDQLRQRMFAERIKCNFFASPANYLAVVQAFPDVTRAWLVAGDGQPQIAFLMEDKYPCGEPLQSDIDALEASLDDDCLKSIFFCPTFTAAKSLSISPEISWASVPADMCAIETVIQNWLRANVSLGEPVNLRELDCYLREALPEFGPTITCCDEFPAVCDGVYNCVELFGGDSCA